MTHVDFALPGDAEADARAVPVAKPPDSNLDARLRGSGRRASCAATAARPSCSTATASGSSAAGVGARDKVDADALRTAGAATAQALSRVGGTLAWQLDDSLPVPLPEQAAALVEGTILGAYSPGRWKSKNDTRPFEQIVIAHEETPELREAVERAAVVADRANRARDLANMPPNELTPATLAEHAAELAAEHEHLIVRGARPRPDARARDGLAPRRRPGQPQRAAPHRPPLRPAERHEQDVVLGLVGKSITFDTGGISIKPAGGMQEMKGDMAGGAGTLHGIGALAALGTPGARDCDSRRGGEHARRRRLPARRHPPRRERQDDRGHQHRRRGTPRARRRALVRAARGSDARARSRHAHRRDGARARRLLRRHLRERRRVARADRRGRGERSGDHVVAVPAPPALPALHRLDVRGHEERLDPAPGLAGARGRVPPGVRRRRPVGAHRHGRPGFPRAEPRRLPPCPGGTGYGVRLIAELGKILS